MWPALGKGTIRRKNSKLRYAYCSKAQHTLHTTKKIYTRRTNSSNSLRCPQVVFSCTLPKTFITIFSAFISSPFVSTFVPLWSTIERKPHLRSGFRSSAVPIMRAPLRARYIACVNLCNTRGGNAHNYEETLLALRAVNRLRSNAKR